MLGAASTDVGGIAGWVVDVIESIGVLGVGVLITLENVFPPIPSEVVLPFAGFSSARGEINVVAAWLAATLGAIAGAWILYALGAFIGYDRLYELAGKRRFVLFSRTDLRRGDALFRRNADVIIVVARCIPLVRSIVSVPAGIAGMPLLRFTVLTALGSGVWNAIFIAAGYRLGQRWSEVEHLVAPVGYAVTAVVAAALVVLAGRRVVQRSRQ